MKDENYSPALVRGHNEMIEITDKRRVEFCNTNLVSLSLLSPKSKEENIAYEIKYLFKDNIYCIVSDTFTKSIDAAIEFMERHR